MSKTTDLLRTVEWKRDPWGCYGPAAFVDARLAYLKKKASDA